MSIFRIFNIKLHIFVLISLLSFSVNAQSNDDKPKMDIVSFKEAEMDQTANLSGTMRMDHNGNKAALIKVETTEHNFRFDVGSIATVVGVENQSKNHPAEIWVYVQEGTNKLSIQHPDLGNIRDYKFNKKLKGGRTYILKLNVTSDQRTKGPEIDYTHHQYLQMNIFPTNAEFYINGVRQSIDAYGRCEIPLAFGEYSYRITAPNYHMNEGQITIDDPNNMQIVNIRLKQAFGYLSTNNDNQYTGADVFVDNKFIGQYPIIKYPVNSGKHTITIKKKLYFPYEKNIEMTDSAFIEVKPILTENCANIKLTVQDNFDAQIYCDGVLMGNSKWGGKLEAGKHLIEVKKQSHRTYSEKITVHNGEDATIVLKKPIGIYGKLDVRTEPSDAQIFINGQGIDKGTPIIENLLIGNYNIEIRKDGYKTEKATIQIKDGSTEYLYRKLTDYCDIKIFTDPSTTDIYLDDKCVEDDANSPYNLKVEAGEYNLKIKKYGYTTYSKKLKLNGQSKNMEIKLHRDLTRSNEIYAQIGYNVLGAQGLNCGIGGYLSNFNIEGNIITDLNSKEKDNTTNGDSNESEPKYQFNGYNVKLGYGLKLNSRFRITPQVGCQILEFKKDNISDAEKKANIYSLTFGMRVNYAFSTVVGISISPEYLYPISESEGYKALTDLPSKMKKYSDGFGCNISLNLFF